MKTNNKNLKNMSNSVQQLYGKGYLQENARRINVNSVRLPNEVRSVFKRIADKFGATYYGSVVMTSAVKGHKTNDFDIYLPNKQTISKFCNELKRVWGDRVKFTYNPKYETTKVEYLLGHRWIEVSDIALAHPVEKRENGYAITSRPMMISSSRYPVRKLENGKSQTLEAQTQRLINANAHNSPSKSRYGKDATRLGIINRANLQQLLNKYVKTRDPALKREITSYLRSIVNFSNDRDIQVARRTFELAAIRAGLCQTRLFDVAHRSLLKKISAKLSDGSFDLDKDLRDVDKFSEPTKYEKRDYNKRDDFPQEMTAYRVAPRSIGAKIRSKVRNDAKKPATVKTSLLGGMKVGAKARNAGAKGTSASSGAQKLTRREKTKLKRGKRNSPSAEQKSMFGGLIGGGLF